MNNHSKESNERELNIYENNNNTNIDQSDLPQELLTRTNKDIFCDSKNENETTKDKKQVQNVVLLHKYEHKEILGRKTILSFITIILFGIIGISFFGISIADIVIQIINPNGLNPYLIDDILIFILPSILAGLLIYLESCMKDPEKVLCIVSIIFLILMIGGYIAINIIFFKYFFERNKSPKYIKDFYLSYIIIKFCDLGVGILYLIFLIIYFHIIPKEKKEEELKSFQLILASPDI